MNNNDNCHRQAHRDGRGRDTDRKRRAYRPRYDHDQEVNQGEGNDLRRSLPCKVTRDHIKKHINNRAAHENICRVEYDVVQLQAREAQEVRRQGESRKLDHPL